MDVVILRIYAAVLLIYGFALLGGGAYLVALGGSPYYVSYGAATCAAALLLWRRRSEGATLYGTALLFTLAWALWESGYQGWILLPRVGIPVALGLVLLIPPLRRVLTRRSPGRTLAQGIGAIVGALVIGAVARAFVPPAMPADPLFQTGFEPAPSITAAARPTDQADGEWRNYGNDLGGTRFSPLAQITPANVAKLTPAWSVELGLGDGGSEATALMAEQTLYVCTGRGGVRALDAETGKQLWTYGDPSTSLAEPGGSDGHSTSNCRRGVAYYRAHEMNGSCATRIFTVSIPPARQLIQTVADLVALDARSGIPCEGFGVSGRISLLTGLGEIMKPAHYGVSSPPLVVQGMVVVNGTSGGDDGLLGHPGEVIRAFDALTGKLIWVWDMGHPDRKSEPANGASYTRGTAGSWAPMSADEALGLIYIPMENADPNQYGGHRRAIDEKYASSIVAIEAATGNVRWTFQTVHHDLWDYDTPSQSSLVNYTKQDGTVVPALVQATKQGELYVLDRATGLPLSAVEERAVPQRGAAPGEHLSPTQPFSVGMPSFRGADLVEGNMWGLTPLDQLWCRIKFREYRYDGFFTPPGPTTAIEYPGWYGATGWGGVAVDTDRQIAIVNSFYFPYWTRLVTKREVVDPGRRAPKESTQMSEPDYRNVLDDSGRSGVHPYFLSPLRVPCTSPPYGRLSAVDLNSGKLVWTQVFGTAREIGPLRLKSGLPITVGTLNAGSGVATATGVLFIGSSADRTFRAYETATGRILWDSLLPASGMATPTTYLSRASGRQFVVIVAGGRKELAPGKGDYLVAYALPRSVIGPN